MIDTFDGERVDPTTLTDDRLREVRATTVQYGEAGDMDADSVRYQLELIDEVIDSRNDELWRPDGTRWEFDLQLDPNSPAWLAEVFTEVVRIAANKLIERADDGGYDQVVEVHCGSLGGVPYRGIIREWMGEDSFVVDEPIGPPMVVEMDNIYRFRA